MKLEQVRLNARLNGERLNRRIAELRGKNEDYKMKQGKLGSLP
jgi:hypothetical protein